MECSQARCGNDIAGEYAYNRLLSHGFHNVKFLNPPMGHPYDFLPVNEAIEHLDALTTEDVKLLLSYAEARLAKKDWRTIGMVLNRSLADGKSFDAIRQAFETEASKKTTQHLNDIQKGVYGKWVDRFFRWKEDFALAESASEVMDAWNDLSTEHSKAAKELATKARKAFNDGNANEGWEMRKQIVIENFASPKYSSFKMGVEKKYGKLHKLVKPIRR